jgi:hypothetical protein
LPRRSGFSFTATGIHSIIASLLIRPKGLHA